MYCPNCGARLAQALSYCNHCGANLSTNVPGKTNTTGTSIDTLVWVIVGTTITLLGMALGALVLIKNGTIDEGLGKIFVILSFVAFALDEAVLIARLLHLNKSANENRGLPQGRGLTTVELAPPPARMLPDPGDPVPSITEQTTRSFEPSYREGERL